MGASVTLEKTGMEEFFEFYAKARQKTMPEVLRINARLLAVELAHRTQPYGKEDSVKKVGESAVARDLLGGKKRYGIFSPISPSIENGMEEYSTGNIRLFVKKDGTVYGTDRAHILNSASAGTLRGIHREAFQNGKMSSAGSRTRDIGRWKFINKYFVPASVLSSYVASAQAKVGLAKSGWAACAKQLKGAVKGSPTRGIPRWVTRHLGDFGFGYIQDNADKADNPSITLTNTCRYADKVCPENTRAAAVAMVKQNMVKQVLSMLRYERKQMKAAA